MNIKVVGCSTMVEVGNDGDGCVGIEWAERWKGEKGALYSNGGSFPGQTTLC